MLGALRLLLALAVAASHANFRIGPLNPGVIAVIGFYLISGYVMAGLIQRNYSQPGKVPAFYLDRAIRLLPQYLCYFSLTLAWQRYTGVENSFLSHSPTIIDLINNLTIAPLNYYMWNSSDRYVLIPPAWSLGAEIQFYLIAPFLLVFPKRMLVAGVFSLSIYLSALGGLINSDWYGYRLLPGVLIFFLLGALIQGLHHQQRDTRAAITTALAAVLATIALSILQWHGTLHQPYNAETLLGLVLGVTLLHILATRPRTLWDDFVGDISYGVFLNHFLVLWTIYPQGVNAAQLPGFLAISIVLAWFTQHYIERPLLKWRRMLRRE